MEGPTVNYFNNLLHKYQLHIPKLTHDIEIRNQRYEDQINDGKYEIKELETVELKSEDSKSKLRNIIKTKKDLQHNLSELEMKLSRMQDQNKNFNNNKEKVISEEEREKFIQELARQKKQMEIKRQERIREIEEKEKIREQERKAKEEQQKMEKEKRKKQNLEQKIRNIMSNKEKRQSEALIQNKLLESVVNTKPLHEKLESNFIHQQALSLEQKKKKLADIRALHKPLSRAQFEQHQKKIAALRQKRQSSILSKPQQRSTSVPDVYKSLWYNKIKQQSNSKEDLAKLEQQQIEKTKQIKEKIKKYSDYVKTNFKPEIDQKKVKEIEQAISAGIKINQPKPDQAKRIGLEYLKYSKEHINQNRAMTELNTSLTNSNLQKKPINYLQELRKNRQIPDQKAQVDNIIRNTKDEKQKTQKILDHVQKLEEKTKRKEKLSKVTNQMVNEELDQMYMDAIKAKLALLK